MCWCFGVTNYLKVVVATLKLMSVGKEVFMLGLNEDYSNLGNSNLFKKQKI